MLFRNVAVMFRRLLLLENELKHGPLVVDSVFGRATLLGGAIEIAVRAEGNRVRIHAVGATGEGMENHFGPGPAGGGGWQHLVNGPVADCSTADGRAVEHAAGPDHGR